MLQLFTIARTRVHACTTIGEYKDRYKVEYNYVVLKVNIGSYITFYAKNL